MWKLIVLTIIALLLPNMCIGSTEDHTTKDWDLYKMKAEAEEEVARMFGKTLDEVHEGMKRDHLSFMSVSNRERNNYYKRPDLEMKPVTITTYQKDTRKQDLKKAAELRFVSLLLKSILRIFK